MNAVVKQIPETFDDHTYRALLATASDLTMAVKLSIERIAFIPTDDPVQRALDVYDVVHGALMQLRRLR